MALTKGTKDINHGPAQSYCNRTNPLPNRRPRHSNRYAANAAFIALVGAEYGIHTEDGRKWATKEINYILGDAFGGPDEKTGLPKYSFVVGYGLDFPRVRHVVGLDWIGSTL